MRIRSEPPRVAAFDVDGTLTSRDCVVPFLWRIGGPRSVARGALALPLLLPAVARRDRDAIKQIGTDAAFRGARLDDVAARGEQYAAHVAANWMRSDMVAVMRRHQALGDVVVWVSASFEVYLRPLARHFAVDHVLAARLDVDDGGELTGRLHGSNCRGPEKQRRLAEWCAATFGPGADALVIAYGDSPGDEELLAHADIGHWVARRAVQV